MGRRVKVVGRLRRIFAGPLIHSLRASEPWPTGEGGGGREPPQPVPSEIQMIPAAQAPSPSSAVKGVRLLLLKHLGLSVGTTFGVM